jgi:hypothetical protein
MTALKLVREGHRRLAGMTCIIRIIRSLSDTLVSRFCLGTHCLRGSASPVFLISVIGSICLRGYSFSDRNWAGRLLSESLALVLPSQPSCWSQAMLYQ